VLARQGGIRRVDERRPPLLATQLRPGARRDKEALTAGEGAAATSLLERKAAMQLHYGTRTAGWQRPSLRHRAGALGLTVLIELAVLLLVVAFGGARLRERIVSAAPTSIVFVPNPAPSPARQRQAERAREEAKPVPRPQRPLPLTPPTPRGELPFVPMSREDLAASDIAKLGTAGAPPGASDADGASAAAVGEGPGGVALYNAEWVTEPSDAQLNGYLPRGVAPGSWALIACQTIAHNQVENCAQLGESPRGSGLSRAMRLAAWQFRIRPPRIGGKTMVGAWVRIRIDFGKAKGEE
jgi:protein TonB